MHHVLPKPWPPLAADHPLVLDPSRRCALCDGWFNKGDRTVPVMPRKTDDANVLSVSVAHFPCAVAFNHGVRCGIERGEDAYEGESTLARERAIAARLGAPLADDDE